MVSGTIFCLPFTVKGMISSLVENPVRSIHWFIVYFPRHFKNTVVMFPALLASAQHSCQVPPVVFQIDAPSGCKVISLGYALGCEERCGKLYGRTIRRTSRSRILFPCSLSSVGRDAFIEEMPSFRPPPFPWNAVGGSRF